MKKRKLFLIMLKLSACTFGGGYVILSLLRREIVEREGALTPSRLSDLIAIAQTAPGPLAVNAALLVGRELAGWPGGLLATLGAVLPPLVILSAASLGYQAIAHWAPVQSMLRFLRVAVAAIVLDVAYDMARGIVRDRFALGLAAAGLIALLLGLNPALVILLGALVGVGRALLPKVKETKA